MNTSLHEFIEHARTKGMDYPTIRLLLISAGWKEKDIAQAMTTEGLELPIPIPPDRGGARDAFFHLLSFAAFYTTVISVIVLFFSYINIYLPDPAADWSGYELDYFFSRIRWLLAAIIVAYPVYLGLTWFLLHEMRAHPEKAASGVRRWLTYLTLFIAAVAIMGDVITLVFNLLEGELSLRFILKVIVVLVLASLTFAYYFSAMRYSPKKR